MRALPRFAVRGGVALAMLAPVLATGLATAKLSADATLHARRATDAAIVSEQIQVLAVVAAQASVPGADVASIRVNGLEAGIRAQGTMDRLVRSGIARQRVLELDRRLGEYYASLALADQLFGGQDLPEARRMATGTAALVEPITVLAGDLVSYMNRQADAAARRARVLIVVMIGSTVLTIGILLSAVGARQHRKAVRKAHRSARAETAEELAEMNRVLRTVTAADAALVHATNEESLLATMCRIVVDTGGYRSAYVAVPTPQGLAIAATYGDSGPAAAGSIDGRGLRRQLEGAVSKRGPYVIRDATAAFGGPAALALPLADDDTELGVLVIASHDVDAFDDGEVSLLEGLARDLSFGIAALRIRAERQRYLARVEHSFEGLVRAVGTTVELRDPYTAGHQRSVADLAGAIAEQLGLGPNDVEGIRVAASIHDIGKIAIPAEILARPGRLTPVEFEMMKGHSQAGADIVADIDFPWPVASMILQHHERMDGSGYPAGLEGTEILLGSRIIAVADTVDAMASHRPYRPSRGIEAAIRQIEDDSGTRFDPEVVDACLAVLRARSLSGDPVTAA